jgi:hypothetical protein
MNLPLAPLIALVAGGFAALGVAMIPVPALEALVMDSGLPSILSMAEPPLGMTARIAVALGSGAFVGAFMWLSAFILLGSRGLTIGGDAEPVDPEEVAVPVLRRADAHPDAPPRPPLLATRDLGKPFLEVRASAPAAADEKVDFDAIFPPRPMSAPATPEPVAEPVAEAPKVHEVHANDAFEPVVEAPESHQSHDIHAREAQPLAEQELPTDFDQPLSAFDPQAIPEMPKPAPVPLAPLRRQPRPSIFDESERFEIFELTPPVRAQMPAAVAEQPRARMVRPDTDASVHALLDRLERGVADKGLTPTRQPKAAERGLEEALVTLRNLARRTA